MKITDSFKKALLACFCLIYANLAYSQVSKINGELAKKGDVYLNNDFITPDNKVVYLASRLGNEETLNLYVANIDGSNQIKLNGTVQPFGGISRYKVVANGQKVLYFGDQDTNNFGELYAVNIDGSGLAKVGASLIKFGYSVAFDATPDGSRVLYIGDRDIEGVPELYSVNMDGTNHIKLNHNLAEDQEILSYKVSDNSRRVIYQADVDADGFSELYAINPDGTDHVRLTSDLKSLDFNYIISPDGKKVIFLASRLDLKNPRELYVIDTDGTNLVKLSGDLVAGGGIEPYFHFLSNNRVVYTGDQDTNDVEEIYAVNLDGSNRIKLNQPLRPNYNVASTFTPFANGSKLIYTQTQIYNGTKLSDFYVVNVDGTNHVKLNPQTIYRGSLTYKLLPDHSKVVYGASFDDQSQVNLYSVNLDGTHHVKLNDELFFRSKVYQYEVTADSKKVIYRSDQDDYEAYEIYSVNVDGTNRIKLNKPLPENEKDYNIGGFSLTPDGKKVIYKAKIDNPHLYELYVSSTDGTTKVKVNGELVSGRSIQNVITTSDSKYIVYMSDQEVRYKYELFSTTLGPRVKASSQLDVLSERNLHLAQMDVDLGFTKFADATLDKANFTLNGTFNNAIAPSVAKLTYKSDTRATLTIAYTGEDFDEHVNDFSVTINATELNHTTDITSNLLSITSYKEIIYRSNNLTTFNTTQGVASQAQTMNVSGAHLPNNLMVSAPENFEVSIDGISYHDELSLHPNKPNGLSTWKLYIRLKATTATVGTLSEKMILSAPKAVSLEVLLSGQVSTNPLIIQSGILSEFTTSMGRASVPQRVKIAGFNLTSGIIATVQPGFEISLDGVTYHRILNLTHNLGTINETSLDVRVQANAPLGSLRRLITLTSDGASKVEIPLSATVNPLTPKITFNGSFERFITTKGLPSVAQSIKISGSNLLNDIVVTAPNGFEVSSDNLTFGPSLTFAQVGGVVNETMMYARVKSSQTVGALNGVITLSSDGVAPSNIPVNAVINKPTPQINYAGNLNAFTANQGFYSPVQRIRVSGTNLTNHVIVTAPNGFEVSLNNVYFGSASTITQLGGNITATTLYVRVRSNVPAGALNGFITMTSNQATQVNIRVNATINPPLPQIRFTGSLNAFTTQTGFVSASQNVQISGTHLIADVIASPTPGFELSLDNNHFSNQVILNKNGGQLTNVVLYIRVKADAPLGNLRGFVSLGSKDAQTVYINLSATINPLVIHAPIIQNASDITSSSFVANWMDANNTPQSVSYQLEVASDLQFSSYLDGFHNYPVSETSQLITGLKPNTTYFYRVIAKNEKGNSNYSETMRVTTLKNITSINVGVQANFKILPNPTERQLYIQSKSHPFTKVVINDLQGRMVISKKLPEVYQTTLYLDSLPKGGYLVKILNEKNNWHITRRFVKK